VILADTNIWGAVNRPTQNPQVCLWVAKNAPDIWLSTIVIAEIRLGIENPKAAAKRADLEQWLEDIESAHESRILAFDRDAAHVFGRLIASRKLEKQETKLLDLQIAAQGIARDATVATRNVKDFAWTGVRLVNPWED
jgi:toxin FitB